MEISMFLVGHQDKRWQGLGPQNALLLLQAQGLGLLSSAQKASVKKNHKLWGGSRHIQDHKCQCVNKKLGSANFKILVASVEAIQINVSIMAVNIDVKGDGNNEKLATDEKIGTLPRTPSSQKILQRSGRNDARLGQMAKVLPVVWNIQWSQWNQLWIH